MPLTSIIILEAIFKPVISFWINANIDIQVTIFRNWNISKLFKRQSWYSLKCIEKKNFYFLSQLFTFWKTFIGKLHRNFDNIMRPSFSQLNVHASDIFVLFLFHVVLIVCVPFPYGVCGRMWNSIVSVLDRCIFIYLEDEHERWF